MAPLYKTQTDLTYREFSKYADYSAWRKGKTLILPIFAAIAIIVAVCSIIGEYLIAAIALGIALAGVSALSLARDIQISLDYKNNMDICNATLDFEFYENRVVQRTEKNTVELLYNEVFTIYETKKNFYIMISAKKGFIIVKKNCTNELCEFIRKIQD